MRGGVSLVLVRRAAIFLIAVGMASAQQQYGTLTGTVTDEQRGVLPGAAVTFESSALIGASQTRVTSGRQRHFPKPV